MGLTRTQKGTTMTMTHLHQSLITERAKALLPDMPLTDRLAEEAALVIEALEAAAERALDENAVTWPLEYGRAYHAAMKAFERGDFRAAIRIAKAGLS